MTGPLITRVVHRIRRQATPKSRSADTHHDISAIALNDRRIIASALPFTMTGIPRLQALVDAVRHCVHREVPGAFAECGVWRGGSVLAMIGALQDLGVDNRDIYLFDTFDGMSEPTERDVSPIDPPALQTWHRARRGGARAWSELFDKRIFSESSVRATLRSTGYPVERLHFVRGPVEETLPSKAPRSLSLLRLDTDWYESTRHELEHLYPLLRDGGVLIIDDYGHWDGCRQAVDEYFREQAAPLLLHRIDYTGRIAVKH